MRKTLTLIVFSLTLPGAALAQMDHSTMDHSTMPMGQDLAQMIHAEATVNAIGNGTVNVTHGPIPEIGWPAMTMDMPMMDGAEIAEGIQPGDKVIMMLGKDGDGMYAIGGIAPMH